MRYHLEKLSGFFLGLNKASNYLETLHVKALTQVWLSKVKGSALLKERWRKGFCFFQPQKLLGTIGYHPNIHIIE